MTVEEKAIALFNALPHRHPDGRVPQWDLQPEDIKNIFRKLARRRLDK